MATHTASAHHSDQGEAAAVARIPGHQRASTVSLASIPAPFGVTSTYLGLSDEVRQLSAALAQHIHRDVLQVVGEGPVVVVGQTPAGDHSGLAGVSLARLYRGQTHRLYQGRGVQVNDFG